MSTEEFEPLQPQEIVEYLVKIYRDPEVSNFERLQASTGLMMFTLGGEIAKLSELLERNLTIIEEQEEVNEDGDEDNKDL